VVLNRRTMQRFDLHMATISARQELENQDDVEALSTTMSPNGTSYCSGHVGGHGGFCEPAEEEQVVFCERKLEVVAGRSVTSLANRSRSSENVDHQGSAQSVRDPTNSTNLRST